MICERCHKTYKITNGIVEITSCFTEDTEVSMEKWDELYKKQLNSKSFYEDFNEYLEKHFNNFNNVYNQIFSEKKLDKESAYLEI